MDKRIIAAAALIFLLTGCSEREYIDVDEIETKGPETSAAQDDSGDESEKEPMLIGSFGVDPENIIYNGEIHGERPTNEEAAQLVSLALEQYRAAQDQDAQGYIDSLSLASVAEPLADMTGRIADAGDDWREVTEKDGSYNVLSSVSYLLYALSGEDFEWTGDRDAYIEAARSAAQGIKADSEVTQAALKSTLYGHADGDGFPKDSCSEDICWIELDSLYRSGDDIYIKFDMGVLDEDTNYIFDDIVGWRTGGQWGIYVKGTYNEENPYKGYDAEKIRSIVSQAEESRRAGRSAEKVGVVSEAQSDTSE